MQFLVVAFVLSAGYPIAHAILAARRISLFSALCWGGAAWLGWAALCATALVGEGKGTLHALRYVALCLTACAGVAVFGARRPIAGPWNFVVLALLAVMLLPLAETHFLQINTLDWMRWLFVVGSLVIVIANYLPTGHGIAAALLGIGCLHETVLVFREVDVSPTSPLAWLMLAAAPWTALVRERRRSCSSREIDDSWRRFRDSYGVVWAQRAREQFNRAATNNGWPVVLSWSGLIPAGDIPSRDFDYAGTFRALLQRFGMNGEQ